MIKPPTPMTGAQSSNCCQGRVRVSQKRLAVQTNFYVLSCTPESSAPKTSRAFDKKTVNSTPSEFRQADFRGGSPRNVTAVDTAPQWLEHLMMPAREHLPAIEAMTFDVPSLSEAIPIPFIDLSAPMPVSDSDFSELECRAPSRVEQPLAVVGVSHPCTVNSSGGRTPPFGASASNTPMQAEGVSVPISHGPPPSPPIAELTRGRPAPVGIAKSIAPGDTEFVVVTNMAHPWFETFKGPRQERKSLVETLADNVPSSVEASDGSNPYLPRPAPLSRLELPDGVRSARCAPEVFNVPGVDGLAGNGPAVQINLANAAVERTKLQDDRGTAAAPLAADRARENLPPVVAGQPQVLRVGYEPSVPAKQVVAAARILSESMLQGQAAFSKSSSAPRTVRLTLSPVGLGTVELILRLRGTELSVILRAEHHGTERALVDDKAVLESEIAGSGSGLSLCRVDVARQDTPPAPGDRNPQPPTDDLGSWSSGGGRQRENERNTAAPVPTATNFEGGTSAEDVVDELIYPGDRRGRIV